MSEAATVKLPGIGPIKRNYVIAGVGITAGIIGYAWYRAKISADAAPPEEALVEPGFEDYTGGLQTGGGGSTTPGGSWQPADPPDPDDAPPTTNGVWTQRGVDYLQNLGFDAQLVATVLGKYLARVPVTASEADIIRTVLGVIGPPPVGEYRIIMVGTPSTPKPPTDPTPKPPSTPPPPAPAATHWKVTVVKYTSSNPPWNSTLSGIAARHGLSWQSVWNDPKNASLKAKRGKPELIRPGDIVYVKKG